MVIVVVVVVVVVAVVVVVVVSNHQIRNILGLISLNFSNHNPCYHSEWCIAARV